MAEEGSSAEGVPSPSTSEEKKDEPSSGVPASHNNENNSDDPNRQAQAHDDDDDDAVSKNNKEKVKRGLQHLLEKKRRIMFTDAAVAIAMTLLILPLMDAAVEARYDEDITTLEWFQENKALVGPFFLSYMLIAMSWVGHDRLFRTVSHFTRVLSNLNFVWLLAIAFFPAATNIMNSVADDPLQHFVWIGTMLFIKVLIFIMTIVVHRAGPAAWIDDGPQFPLLVGKMVSICLLVIALLLSMTPGGYYWTLLSLLKTPIAKLILWKWPGLKTKWKETSDNNNNNNCEDTLPGGSNQEDTGHAKWIRSLLFFRDKIYAFAEAERRIIFTDAAAAIALTLLVLPLMDAATEARGEDISTAEWFQENKALLLSFFLSYLVIYLCWVDQDNLFRYLACLTRILSVLNFLWLLAIVFIPVSTAVTNLVKEDPLQHFLYIGTPLFAKICTLLMTIEVHRNPETWEDAGPKFPLLLNSMIFIVLLIMALFLSMTAGGYWMILITLLKTPIKKAILWKWPSLETKW